MQIKRDIKSPNYTPTPISVEFLVLHYTAGTLPRTLELFTDPAREVSSHLIIDLDGTVYEVVACWDGTAYRAWHAGKSRWLEGGRTWEAFNNFSLGVEIVNLNGQVLPYTEAQYQALVGVVAHFRKLYPALNAAERVVGHEHIAGWRGKADPGYLFDWPRFFRDCYPAQPAPVRQSLCPPELRDALAKFLEVVPEDEAKATRFWHALSYLTETSFQLWQNPKPDLF